jgi:outer membrane protein OmpA-like peptidoglycan-associated protein
MKIITIYLLPFLILILPFSPTLAEDCEKAIELYNRGTLAQEVKQKENLFNEALNQTCNDQKVLAKIHNNLADVYENQKRLHEAIAEYKKAIEFDPELPAPYLSLGEVYSKQRDYKSAEVYYKKFRELTHFKNKDQLRSALSPRGTARAIYVNPTRREKVDLSEDLYFGFNETVLTQESEKQLKELLAALGDDELKTYHFQLAGHTCAIGSDAYNQKLSEARAKAVRDWLAKNGYPGDRLQVTGSGKRKPVADNSTEEGRKLNRRVEIRTIGAAY